MLFFTVVEVIEATGIELDMPPLFVAGAVIPSEGNVNTKTG